MGDRERAGAEWASLSAGMNRLTETWASSTPWRPLAARYGDGVYTGDYRIDLDADRNERAPHRPLLHASALLDIAGFHTMSSSLFAYYHRHHPAFRAVPRMPWAEARRRVLLTEVGMRFGKPVSHPDVTIRLTLHDVTALGDTRPLVFFRCALDIADGRQHVTLHVCLNTRDDLLGTGAAA